MQFKTLPFGSVDAFNVLIEIPKGSSNKYEYDEQLDVLRLDFVFTDLEIPFNYGSIAGTLGGDGDPQDAIVLSTYPLVPGTVVTCKTVGFLEALDRGEVDNKMICFPVADPLAAKYDDVGDFNQEQLREIGDYFRAVGIQKNKIMEIIGYRGKQEAVAELERSRITGREM